MHGADSAATSASHASTVALQQVLFVQSMQVEAADAQPGAPQFGRVVVPCTAQKQARADANRAQAPECRRAVRVAALVELQCSPVSMLRLPRNLITVIRSPLCTHVPVVSC